MQLIKHSIPDEVHDNMLKGISDFFNETTLDERKIYSKKSPSDKMRWKLNSYNGENREYLKVVAHPQYHFPSKPSGFRYIYYRNIIFPSPFYVLIGVSTSLF